MMLLAKKEARLNNANDQEAMAIDKLKHDLVVKLAEGKKIFKELLTVKAVAKEAKMG